MLHRGPKVTAVLVGRWGGQSQGNKKVVWRKTSRQEPFEEGKLRQDGMGVPKQGFCEEH